MVTSYTPLRYKCEDFGMFSNTRKIDTTTNFRAAVALFSFVRSLAVWRLFDDVINRGNRECPLFRTHGVASEALVLLL